MRSSTGKHSFAKSTIVWGFVSLLFLALTADFLWASSSSSAAAYISLASALSRPKNHVIIVQNSTISDANNNKDEDNEKNPKVKVPTRLLSATFADLPAPKMEWEQMPTAPVPRLDGSSIQINNLFYVFSGFGSLDYVHSHVDVYNFTENKWSDRFDTSKEMANSHLGIASDGRYIFVVTGQYGPQCRGPTAQTSVVDTVTRKWSTLPPLPAPRYAPATQFWRGRLHVMGGSKENRHTPGLDHWSIGVKDGKALEKEWRIEVPIPRGGPHRSCVPVGDRLYVIGGQEGDFQPKPGSPIFKCSRRREVLYPDVYMLDKDMKWHTLPLMPKANSHIECSWVVVNNSIIILGGTTENHPINKRMMLVGEVFRFDSSSQEWSVIGRLPYRIKTTLAAYWEGWLYFTSGQRDRGADNPQPKQVVGEMWRTKLSL